MSPATLELRVRDGMLLALGAPRILVSHGPSQRKRMLAERKSKRRRYAAQLTIARWPTKEVRTLRTPWDSRYEVRVVPDGGARGASCGPTLRQVQRRKAFHRGRV